MARTKTTPQAPAEMPEVLPAKTTAIVQAQGEIQQQDAQVRALATTLGYEGALSIGTLEDEIRFYQRRTVEALLETGKRLLLLKEMVPHGEFGQRVEMLGFHLKTAQRFMQAAAKTAKSDKLSFLSTQVKNASAFLELVTHDDDTLEGLKDLDDIDRMSASELRAELRQAKQDNAFEAEKRQKAEERADAAEKKLRGKVPKVVPLSERITPFQVEITERQSLLEKALLAHAESVSALDAWWTEEAAAQPDYDPEQASPLPPSVLAVVAHLADAAARAAQLVGKVQHELETRFGADLDQARQYLMAPPDGEAQGA